MFELWISIIISPVGLLLTLEFDLMFTILVIVSRVGSGLTQYCLQY